MTARTCKREGCCNPVDARGLCRRHYEAWRVANPTIRQMASSEQAVLDSMPGTVGQLVIASGLSWHATRRSLDAMLEDGRTHIGDHEPPTTLGTKWNPIYEAGPGVNKRVTEEMRREHRNATARAGHARRQAVYKARCAVSDSAGWAASIMGGTTPAMRYMPSKKQKGSEDAEAARTV